MNYDEVLINEYLALDTTEKEPHPESAGYCMPHHKVFRRDATTTKTRVVFNASAAYTGAASLSNMVDPGPSLLPDLTSILFRLRGYLSAGLAAKLLSFVVNKLRVPVEKIVSWTESLTMWHWILHLT